MTKFWQGNVGIRDTTSQNLQYGPITNTILQTAVSITTSATKIPGTALTERIIIILQNMGTEPIYLGNSSVSTSDGWPLWPRASLQIAIEPDVILYGIVATNTTELRLLEGS